MFLSLLFRLLFMLPRSFPDQFSTSPRGSGTTTLICRQFMYFLRQLYYMAIIICKMESSWNSIFQNFGVSACLGYSTGYCRV